MWRWFRMCKFQTQLENWYLEYSSKYYPGISARGYHWWNVNIGSGNGLVPSGITWTNFDWKLWCHMASLCHNKLRDIPLFAKVFNLLDPLNHSARNMQAIPTTYNQYVYLYGWWLVFFQWVIKNEWTVRIVTNRYRIVTCSGDIYWSIPRCSSGLGSVHSALMLVGNAYFDPGYAEFVSGKMHLV